MQIVTLNKADPAHLAAVIEQMRKLGAPSIACIKDEGTGVWVALEGSHRVAAAKALGLVPEIVEYEYDGDAMLSDYVELDADNYSIEALFDNLGARPFYIFAE